MGFVEDGEAVGPSVAAVDDEGEIQAGGEGELAGEDFALDVSG